MSTRNLKVGYRLTRNATPTADKAPYLGVAVPVGSLAYDNILSKMIDAGTFMTKATAQYFLNAFYEFAAEEIAANVVRLNTGSVSIYPMIGGAFDSEDDTFKEPRNTLYIGATLSQDIRNAVAGIVPDYLGDEAAAGSVKINSVFDLTTMTNGVINSTNDFRICGIDLTVPDGDDESLTFVKKDGVTKVADIVVSETADGQRITCHLVSNTEAIPKGTYKVRLASHGLDPTAPLSVVTKTVTLTEAIPGVDPLAPKVTRVESEGVDEGEYNLMEAATFEGENLGLDGLVGVKYTVTRDGEVVAEHAFGPDDSFLDAEASTPTALKTTGGVGPYLAGAADGDLLRVDVTNAHGTASVELTLKEV